MQDRPGVIVAVESAYRAHHQGRTVNPDSYFLRFPDQPANRIIALPAHYPVDDGAQAVTGLKWISSFPGNIARGLPRASAVLLLNDPQTGYPMACLESSIISAARTAASAASALKHLSGEDPGDGTVAVIGCGLISRYVVDFLLASGVPVGRLVLHDLQPSYAQALARHCREAHGLETETCDDLEATIRCGSTVVFATTAGEPYVKDPAWFAHNPVVLHLSLRDLSPEVVLASHNVVDDVDHALKARTSLHLTEMQLGHRGFVTCSLPQMLDGAADRPQRDRPIVFSPFGMGILDLALGAMAWRELASSTPPVEDFFYELKRA